MNGPALNAMTAHDDCLKRHIGPEADETAAMLAVLGYPTLEALTDAAVPKGIRRERPMAIDEPRGEAETLAALADIGSQHNGVKSPIGQGFYGSVQQGGIPRKLFEKPVWYHAQHTYNLQNNNGHAGGDRRHH